MRERTNRLNETQKVLCIFFLTRLDEVRGLGMMVGMDIYQGGRVVDAFAEANLPMGFGRCAFAKGIFKYTWIFNRLRIMG